MSSALNFGKSVTLKQAAQMIAACPSLTFLLEGEPGIGKSSLIEELETITGMTAGYIDVGNLDLGDTGTPMPNRELKITEYFPNSRFNLHTGKPVIVMLDEFTKGRDDVKNMLHPLFEKSNPRFGDIPLPKGSIVFLTGNLSTDGVGDSLKAHTLNRIVRVRIQKPSAEEWVQWALGKGLNPAVVAWVSKFPMLMDSYLDSPNNEYIFNPKHPRAAFVSPRSLHTASVLVDQKDIIERDALIAFLSGAIGEAGARQLSAFIEFSDQLPEWASIIANPETTPIPTAPGACTVLAFSAINRVTKETISPWMKYLARFSEEWQATFCINVAKNPSKQAVAFASRSFAEWVAKNQDLL